MQTQAFTLNPLDRSTARLVRGTALLACIGALWVVGASAAEAQPTPPTATASWRHMVIGDAASPAATSHDGQVEALQHAEIAAQVPGAITAVLVKPGDTVKAGQVLIRLDAQAAQQASQSAQAQARAAQASLALAQKERERQRQLFQKNYISRAALDQAEAQFDGTQAQLQAQVAQAQAALAQTDFYTLKAPFNAVVAEVPVRVGDMAMPGKPLLTVYDPSAFRVTAHVPESLAQQLQGSSVQVELAKKTVTAPQVQVLPAVDARTYTQEVRVAMPSDTAGLRPGQFARLWFKPKGEPGASAAGASGPIRIPASAVVKRAELQAVYVLSEKNQPLLRQVRTGRTHGEQVDILSGLKRGDRLVLDPQLAARH